MRKTLALAAALVIAGAGGAFAQSASQQAPGHQSGNPKKDAMPGQSGLCTWPPIRQYEERRDARSIRLCAGSHQNHRLWRATEQQKVTVFA